MLIGIEMMGDQTPMCRERGIGRYTRQLVSELVAKDRENRYLLYYYAGLPRSEFPDGPNVAVRLLGEQPAETSGQALERLAQTNPERLDALLLTCPFMPEVGYAPTPKPLHGLKMASVMYDLIPALFPDKYQVHGARWYHDALQTVRRYDGLLAISEATRQDCQTLLGGCSRRFFNISGASLAGIFGYDPQVHQLPEARRLLARLGITRPFVFNLGGGMEWRKNYRGLITAFGQLPQRVRRTHQLVVTCSLSPDDVKLMRQLAHEHGVSSELVLTDAVSDADLRLLYQTCAAFVFPSFYEGFGLPLLEAMLCGAPVIAGNNSSQVEVVGDAGLLVNAQDSVGLAREMSRVLEDATLAGLLRAQALEQAAKFTWQRTAELARQAIREIVTAAAPRLPLYRTRQPRPRLAYFSPLPPLASGISDYSISLLEKLKDRYSIDLYCDSNYTPNVLMASSDFGCHDYRLFHRLADVVGYRRVVYQMGNSEYHRYIYETLQRHPGIVMLHDFALVKFHLWYSTRSDVAPGHFQRELAYDGNGTEYRRLAELADPECHVDDFLRAEVFLNRRVVEHAAVLAVHDSWNLQQIVAKYPEYAERVVVIPEGAEVVEPMSREARQALRARFGLPPETLIVGSFGLVDSAKMNVEALEAFAALAATDSHALFLFVGPELDGQLARHTAHKLGIARQVRFLGRQSNQDFIDLATIVDIGINLRRPPTQGETSAALLRLLGAGTPCIVTDIDTFSSYPDDVVAKVPAQDPENRVLQHTLLELAANGEQRERMSSRAREYVRTRHDWSRAADLYVKLIEEQASRGGSSTSDAAFGCPSMRIVA